MRARNKGFQVLGVPDAFLGMWDHLAGTFVGWLGRRGQVKLGIPQHSERPKGGKNEQFGSFARKSRPAGHSLFTAFHRRLPWYLTIRINRYRLPIRLWEPGIEDRAVTHPMDTRFQKELNRGRLAQLVRALR